VAAGIGLAVAALAGWVVARSGDSAVALVRTEVVGLSYLVAGTIAWRRRPDNPTGPILVAIACAWYIPEFEAAPVPAVASLAFAARRLVNLLSVYLLLAFPSGRLTLRRDRLTMALVIATAAVQMPTRLLMTGHIPATLDHADRITVFGCDCANPFGVIPAPELLDGVERWTAYLSIVLSLVVLGLVILRLVQASGPMRRLLWPVLLGAAVGLLVFAINLLSELLYAQAGTPQALGWALTLARAAVPIGFMAGLLRMKIGQAAVAGLVVGIQGGRSADALERSIAQALRDPSVRLGYWSPAAGTYVDGRGKTLTMPKPGSALSVARVDRDDAPLGAILHDAALDHDDALLDAVSAAFALAVDRDRLAASVHAQAADARQLPGGPVTFLYSDVEESTRLLAALGERYAGVLAEKRRLLRAAVRAHGGFEVDSRADEFFAVFALAGDPLGAALEIQRRLRDHAWPEGATLRVRIGLHRGQPQMTDEGYVGLDVHRAARIGSAGHGGQILLSEAAREHLQQRLPPDASLRRLGAFSLKGLPGLEPISQIVVPDLPDTFPALRLDPPAPVVDRDDEAAANLQVCRRSG